MVAPGAPATTGGAGLGGETPHVDAKHLVELDLGALLGLVFALTGVVLAAVTHEPRFDALGSVAIGLLLGVIAVVLAIEMKSLLIGEGASASKTDAIRAAIQAGPRVRRLIHMRTQYLGPDELLVAAKIELDGSLAFTEVAGEINAAERRIRERVPEARIVYLEPDSFGGERGDGATGATERRGDGATG